MPVIVEEASTGNLPQLHLTGLDRIRTSRTFQVSITGPELTRLPKDGPDAWLHAAIMDSLYPIKPEASPDIAQAIDYQQEAT